MTGTQCDRRIVKVLTEQEKLANKVLAAEKRMKASTINVDLLKRSSDVLEECNADNQNTTYSVGCRSCTCYDGAYDCVDVSCDAQCSIIGQGHFETFDGTHFAYPDPDCSLTIARECSSSQVFKVCDDPYGLLVVTKNFTKIFFGRRIKRTPHSCLDFLRKVVFFVFLFF
eukprot:sb/3472246/